MMETKSPSTPPDIVSSGEQVFDVAFHPSDSRFIAVASITGLVEIFQHSYNNSERNKRVNQLHFHESSCRGVLFSDDGNHLISVSSDKSWFIVDGAGAVVSHCADAHSEPINKIAPIPSLFNCFLSGDDSGCVKLWDPRVNNTTASMSWHEHEDYISAMLAVGETGSFFSSSGDATLCAYDTRSRKVVRSDEQESELHSLACIKHGRKLLTGTQEGVLLVFSWGKWGDCSDRYPGHPESVDCLLKIDEDTILTGSSDGLIRVVAIQPNKVLGVVGDHDDFPVEGFGRSSDGRLLASYAHDDVVRFWDLSLFIDDEDEADCEGEGGERSNNGSTCGVNESDLKPMAGRIEYGELNKDETADDEWEDMDEEKDDDHDLDNTIEGDDHSDDNEIDDSNDDTPGESRGRRLQSATERFFADL